MRSTLLILASLLYLHFTGFAQSRNVGIGEISVIEFSTDSGVWVGSNGNGIIKYDPSNQAPTYFTTSNTSLKSDSVTAILCRTIGATAYVFIGTSNGVSRFVNNIWDTIATVSGQHITGLMLTGGDSLWVVTANNGAFIFDSTGQTSLGSFNTGNSPIPTDQISTAQLGATNCGNYTIGTFSQGCFYTSDGINYSILDTTPEHRNLVDNHVTAVYMKKDCSAMFVGTKNGYSSCPPGVNCTNFTTGNSGLPQNYITAIGEDCNGKVWLGTKDSGVIIYNPRINATSKFTDVYDSIQRDSYFLTKANDGFMYGAGTTDGEFGAGLFFWFNPATYAAGGISLDTVYDHGNIWNPVGNPVAIDTIVWGVTLSGGAYGLGTVYRFYTNHHDFILTAAFDTSDGSPPVGITKAANDTLYGVTGFSLNYPYGTVFQYPINPPHITRVAIFDSIVTGAYPDGNLTVGDNGLIYGSTPVGGAFNKGTLFQFDPETNTLTKLYDFHGAPDGDHPSGPVIRGSDGLLYGTTQKGGATDNGILFAFDSANAIFTKVNEFDAAHATPIYLYQAQNGIFYGLTQSNNGSLFQYNRYNGVFNSIYQFDDTDGIHLGSVPYPNMTENPQGNVFGRTSQGGLLGIGAIFQFNPQYAELATYSTANGLASNQITAIAFDPNNCGAGSFIGTSDGNIATVDSSGNLTQILAVHNIIADKPGVYLYPQPASGELKFVLSKPVANGELIISDMAGRRLMQYNTENEAFLTTDVSILSSGIYFYSLVSGDGVIASGKISVVR